MTFRIPLLSKPRLTGDEGNDIVVDTEVLSVDIPVGFGFLRRSVTRPIPEIYVDHHLCARTINYGTFSDEHGYLQKIVFHVDANTWYDLTDDYQAKTGRPITDLPLKIHHVSPY